MYIKDVNSYCSLLFNDGSKLSVASIPFMNVEQTFSSPIDIDNEYSFIKDDLTDIEESKMITIPDTYNQKEVEEEYTQTDLF